MDRNTPIIQPAYILECLDVIEQLTEKLPKTRAGFDDFLVKYRSDPQWMSINETNYLIERVYREMGAHDFGLSVGMRWSLMCHGLASFAAMSQQTYKDCLVAATRLCEKLFPAYVMELVESDEAVLLRIIETTSLAPLGRFYAEAVLTNFYNILKFLLGQEVEPLYLGFGYPAPEYAARYRQFFQCPVRFDQPDTVFAVSIKTAARSLKLADVQSASLVEKTFAASMGPVQADTLISDLRKIFQQQRQLPDLSEAATLLSMSSRTLHRKLQMMGTNYLNEIELYRKDLACEMLRTSTRPITDIALRLGYYDSSAFSKAFKKWTGESPRTYKKRIESLA